MSPRRADDELAAAYDHPAVRDLLAVFPGTPNTHVEAIETQTSPDDVPSRPPEQSSLRLVELTAADIPWRGTASATARPPADAIDIDLLPQQAPPASVLPFRVRFCDERLITLDPDQPPSSPVMQPPAESRQVRRARERREVKRPADVHHEPQTPPLCALTDSGNAEFFEQIVNGQLAFDHRARQWFEFNGHHWHPDTVKHVLERALGSVRQQQHAANRLSDADARKAALRWTIKSEDHRHLHDLLTLAAAKPSIAVDGTNWDRDPMLIGVINGVVDLTTRRFRDGQPADYITKVAPVRYDAAATCPRFEQFMTEIFRDHPDLVAYLQRVFGYCLTGLTDEQMFWIFCGRQQRQEHVAGGASAQHLRRECVDDALPHGDVDDRDV